MQIVRDLGHSAYRRFEADVIAMNKDKYLGVWRFLQGARDRLIISETVEGHRIGGHDVALRIGVEFQAQQ
jgi:hypothetical protein